MNFLYDQGHEIHQPGQVMRLGAVGLSRDVPARGGLIRAALRDAGHHEERAEDHGIGPVAAVHTAEYVDFLQSAYAEWTKLPGTSGDVLPHTFPVRDMTTYPRSIAGRAGYHMQDLVAPIGAGTYEAARRAANLAADAATRVLGGARRIHALCRPSGHHAYADMGGGACYLNNAAIAAERLRREVRRVAVVDIDVHHGNGTQSIFYDRGDVLFVSLHRDPVDYWPYLIGHHAERGSGLGESCNLNLPLPAGADDDAFLDALDVAARRVEAFGPDALVVSLGVDAHRDDPSDGLRVTDDGFARIGERLADLRYPTVFVQEGGYNLDTLGRLVAAVLGGFETRHG